MSRAVVVQYTLRPDAVEENVRLVRAVYDELAEQQPEGFRYSTLQIDETSFMHIAIVEGDTNPLDNVAAFKTFTADIAARCVTGPDPRPATLVGRYG
jgi:hypothetical protein